MCVAVVLWHSQLAHFMFVCAIGISTVKPLGLVKHRCFELLLDFSVLWIDYSKFFGFDRV